MNGKTVNTTIEILGKFYPIRCDESEVKSLQEAAQLVNVQMKEVQESGKAINLERIAIITALNISNLYLQATQQKNQTLSKINDRISDLQDKIESSLNQIPLPELIYSAE